jgi:hypothetical protein
MSVVKKLHYGIDVLGQLLVNGVAVGSPADFAAAVHDHAFAELTATPTTLAGYGITDGLVLGETSTKAYRGDYGTTAYNHSQAAHAPSNAQAHIAATKVEVEAVLTGAITSHSHAYSTLALGETLSTAYRGDRGAIAYSHSQIAHSPSGATINSTDATLLARANHTGTQLAATISNFDTEVSNNTSVTANTTYKNIGHIPLSLKGAINGVAELDASGLIPSSQLPSYVDDVLEYANLAAFPASGEASKVYIAIDTNITYRWSGTVYTVIGSSLALGETSATAYRGDRGATAYTHSQTSHAPSNAQAHIAPTKGEVETVLTGVITSHSHNYSTLALGTTSTTAYRGDYGNTAYVHSQAAHAPSNAQAHIAPTKGEIEGVLTGAITSHTHAYSTLALGSSSSTAYRGDLGTTAYNHSQAAHAPSNANYITDNNQLLNGAGYITSYVNTVYTHPTTAGYKHVPTGGAAGQFLKWSASGTAVWAADNNSTYTLASLGYTGATNANYITDNNQLTNGASYITAAGSITGNAATATWADTVDVNSSNTGAGEYQIMWNSGDTVYSTTGITINRDSKRITATTFSASGGNSTEWNTGYDHSQTAHAPSDANNYVHPMTEGFIHVPPGGSIGKFLKWSSVGVAVWADDNNTTYVKATGTELNTGTDDAKFATAKALADSKYFKSDETATLTNKTLDDAKVKTAINAQTGTTYTLVLTDDSKLVTLSNAAAITLTVPTNASVAFPIGCQIDLVQLGAGAVTVGGASVTINSKDSNLTINGQYVGASLVKIATDTWLLLGDLV